MFGCSPILITFGGVFHPHFFSRQLQKGWGGISLKTSGETTNMAIPITNGDGERDLCMAMVFCHPYQAKMEACDALSGLNQCDSSELSLVVVRRYSNTPYIPRGMVHSLYLDVDSLSGGISSAQFPLDRLHLHQLLPFNRTEVLLPHKVGEEVLGDIPPSPRVPMGGFERGTSSFWSHLPVGTSSGSSSTTGRGHPDQGGPDHHPTSTQREGQATTHPSNFYKTTIRPGLYWNMSSSRKHRNWLKGTSLSEPNRPGGMQGGRHSFLIKQMPPPRRYSCKQVQWRPSHYCLGASLWPCLSAT